MMSMQGCALRNIERSLVLSEPVKSRLPNIWFVWKIWDFLVTQGQKLDTRGNQALPAHILDEVSVLGRCP